MKKFTLLLCLFVVSVMMPQVVLAEGEPTTETLSTSPLSITKSSDGVLTISSVNAGDLKTFMLNSSNSELISSKMVDSKSIVLIGYFNSEDLSSISNGAGFDAVESVDMNDVIFPTNKANYLMNAVNSIPDRGNPERVYITGSTIYVGQQITTIDENLSQETIESVSNWQEWAWDYQKQTLEAGWYKLFVSAYYERKKGRYVVDTPDQSDVENYVAADAVPATNNGNDLIYVLENETTTYYQWDNNEEYWAPISSLPANVDETVYTDNVEGINNPEVGKIYRIKSGSYLYCHILKPFVWAQGVKDVNDQSLSFYYKNIKDAPAPQSAQDFAVVGGVFHYYYLNEWTTEESNWLLTDFSYWSSTLKTAILPSSVTMDILKAEPTPFDGCSDLTMLVLGNTYATITRGEYNSAQIHNASSDAEINRLKEILVYRTGFGISAANISSNAIAESPGYNSESQKYIVAGSLTAEQLASEITKINDNKSTDFTNGLVVLDLKNVSNLTSNNLKSLTNPDIEYIVLPGDKTKDLVCDTTNYYESGADTPRMSKLKAVISAQSTNLVAHVVVPGHLAQARCYATGIKQNREGRPAVKGLTSVTLSGNLNADDISTHDEDKGLSGENFTITTMDLEKAYFANYNDMKFQAAGFQGQSNECVLKHIKLPTTPRMTDIPQDCFRNMKSLDSLCIPFNYKHIHNGALYDSNVEHLTTTDSIGGAVIDNGMYTYTLSANIEELGDAPSPKLNGDGKPNGTEIYVFPKENGVTEIYSLATKVPKCYREAFSYDVTFGYGGQDESKVYSRDRYFNNGERQKSFVVLRYPSKEVFARRKAKNKPVELPNGTVDEGYALMEKKYTDVTKDYTKQDQTGAVDANGKPLLWPSRTEMNRSHNQASVGALWNDWSKSYTGSNNSEINFDEDPVYNNSNGRLLREDTPATTLDINLGQGMTQYVERSVSGSTYTFTPTADVQNMFQYMPYDVDNKTFNKIVIEFADTVPEGFFIHHYGEHGTYYSLKGLKKYEFALTGPTIDDFTIFNWDSYWGEGFEYEAQQDRRNIKISRAYLTSDEVAAPVTTSKYGHESDITPDFIDYMGWHQIVLTQAVYYEPVEKEVEEEVTSRRYEDAGWFTFCIPYDMTYSQVVKMLGVPASTDKVKNYIGDSENPVAEDIMPDIRQLKGVERVAGNGTANKVTFRLTTNLADKANLTAKYLEFTPNDNNMTTMSEPSAKDLSKTQSATDPICLVGGRPYIIKAYKRKGETISKQNLGKYVLTRYSDEFRESASCVNSGDDYSEQLKTYTYNYTKNQDGTYTINSVTNAVDGGTTMRFAKPYEKHKVQAFDGSIENGSQLTFTENGKTYRYYYTMIGQFWQQDLPQYSIYMSGGNWYRYTDTSQNFQWAPYKCVIMATPEEYLDNLTTQEQVKNVLNSEDENMLLEDVKAKAETSGGFRDFKNCYFPMNLPGTFDWLPAPLKLWFFGRDDSAFSNQNRAAARYVFTMDDEEEIIEYGEDATAVKTIDMLDGVSQGNGRSTKVYGISGQYVGNTTEGLPKGVYIVGGRKIVVD